jgi:Fe-S oxidoreductase
VTQAPGLSAAVKWAGGIAQARAMPRYAKQSFVSWFSGRESRRKPSGSGRVMLWPDTFNNYFRPGTAIAAVKALEGLGFSVAVPARPLCCGRPLYDWGMLEQAKQLWQETMVTLEPEIEAGTVLVGLEPACVSAFRDELPGLFPNDSRAARLSKQTLFFTEFLDQYAPKAGLPQSDAKALVQFHCHHHAVLDPAAERRVLNRMGLDYEVMASGCCGMAGSFGFESDKYEVSMRAAERVLLPKIRASSPATLVLADGFSCREQIEQGTGRNTLHVADLIAQHLPAETS